MGSRSFASVVGLAVVAALFACGSGTDTTTIPPPPGPITFASNPCTPTGTLTLTVATSTRVDCTNGGTTLTLAGNGASYLIIPQFPTNLVVNQAVSYTLTTGNLAAASLTASRVAAMRSVQPAGVGADFPITGTLWPGQGQREFERGLFARAAMHTYQPGPNRGASLLLPPTLGSTRTFKVLSNFNTNTWTQITAQLAYLGNNIYLYIDVNAPANGFNATQLANFGLLFDQTLYGIATNAFGQPSDIDANGHVIMLMSPLVNADTPASACASTGFVAGFFDAEDFDGSSNPHSNQAEVFYSVVPDPSGTVSCAHTVADIGLTIPGTFLHELEHLISYSQHVVVNHLGAPSSGLDEGLAIVAEELGSLYYEQKCPPPACRTNAAQLFPDSSQGFIQSFFNDSYLYAALPDTVSLTLHNDSENGFSWRGGDWLLMRYLGDQYGSTFFRSMMTGPADGLTSIASITGVPVTTTFANLGIALFTDSLPGLPRATAPAANRFLSRNVRQLWARLFATAGPSTSVPRAMPLQVFAIGADTTVWSMSPGASSYWRLDTPASSATVSIRFAKPGGGAFSTLLRPQLAVFRLPAGQ